MKGLEDLGLLKMDFLGLRNLTVIDRTIKLIQKQGITIDIEDIQLDDPKVYKMFTKGLTVGIFQFESSGMREFLKKLKPTSIDDLIAMNALYRPGPMKNINEFISRKHGEKKTITPAPTANKYIEDSLTLTSVPCPVRALFTSNSSSFELLGTDFPVVPPAS